MINTHKKMFKYRAIVGNVVKAALTMNYCMVAVQSLMCMIIFNKIISQKSFTINSTSIPLRVFGEIIILIWFLCDLAMNCVQIVMGTIFVENCHLLVNDIMMHECETNAAKQVCNKGDEEDCDDCVKERIVGNLNLKFVKLEPNLIYTHGLVDFFDCDNDEDRCMEVINRATKNNEVGHHH